MAPDASAAAPRIRSRPLLPGRKLGWEIEQLAEDLASLPGHHVDLVSLRAPHPRLKPAVLAEARALYAA